MVDAVRYDLKLDSAADVRAVTLGTVVELLRQSKGWSQSELAERAGTTQATISRIEKGTNEPSPQVGRRIAEALDLRPSKLERIVENAEALARERAGAAPNGKNGAWWHGVLKGLAVAGLIGLIVWAVASVLTDEGELEPGEE